ncbi:MAG TPA: acetate--CoA ligase family protein [Methylomirabilota bacterium]|jgi:acetyltransferase|nr:acetate--CoA ligase family protein [Methylomirabilota bacterium]
MMGPLAPFYDARAVAVIGASADPSKVGGSVLANLRAGGFTGRVIPVNRARPVVQGLAAVPSIMDAGAVDVAVVAVPAPDVLAVLKQCAAHGVKGAVVVSAGFREVGAAGAAREAELRAWLRTAPLRVIGPNCLGWIRPAAGLNLSFAPGMPRAGALGFFSHSGALCTAILDWSREHALGFSLFASLGNQADVTESDLLDALAADTETRVILGYLEGVADGAAFFHALRAAARRKPCVVLKTGRSEEGARAVGTHTGALAGSDRAFDAAVRQAGAIRVTTLEELFDVGRGLVAGRTPTSRRVVLVTNGGGLGILATDAARAAGLELAPLDAVTRGRLALTLPPQAAAGNPVDLIGDATPQRYADALESLRGVDAALVVMLAPQAATDAAGVARSVLAGTRGWPAPVLGVFAGGARVRAGAAMLEEAGVPCYAFPERAVGALARMAEVAERARHKSIAPVTLDPVTLAEPVRRLSSGGPLSLVDAAPLLDAAGIPRLPMRTVASPDEAADTAEVLGLPVALKVLSRDISHKTDVGGVVLGLATATDVRASAKQLLERVHAARPDARIDGLLVQRMASPGAHELLLGMVRDAQFGPLVMVGFGGIYVEILDDVAVRLAPLDHGEARRMLAELRMAPALRGARGRPPADLDALADVICRFAALAVAVPALAELEINPLLAGPAGVCALDARGRLVEARS